MKTDAPQHFSILKDSHGMTILGVMVAVLIALMVGTATSLMMRNSMTGSQQVQRENDLEDLRNFYRLNFDCAKTVRLALALCPL